MPRLAADHDVVAVDMRGYGDSDKPVPPADSPGQGYDLASVAGDLAGLLDALDLGPAAVVGHDMGAPPALYLAQTHGALVDRLAYLDEPVYSAPDFTAMTGLGSPLGQALWWSTCTPYPSCPRRCSPARRPPMSAGSTPTSSPARTPSRPRTPPSCCAPSPAPVGSAARWPATGPSPTASSRPSEPLAEHGPLDIPVLGLGGAASLGDRVTAHLRTVATQVTGGSLQGCGHFLAEEQPGALLDHLLPFLAQPGTSEATGTATSGGASQR